jgi:hypothetical protein
MHRRSSAIMGEVMNLLARRAYVAGAGRLVLEDRVISGGATEFTIPRIATYAVIDLRAAR